MVTGVIRHQDGKRAISVLTMRSFASLGRENENFRRQIDFARQTRPKSRRFYYQFRGSLEIRGSEMRDEAESQSQVRPSNTRLGCCIVC